MPEDDERWFRELWDGCAEDVLAYARRRTDPDTAREVVAGTFLVAWRRRADVPSEALPWLYGVARRVLADQTRSRHRQWRLAERLRSQGASGAGTGPGSGDPARCDPASRVADRELVLDALDRLPGKEREALALVCWEQLPYRDAAAVAGCSVTAFGVRVHRARRRLRRRLETVGVDVDTHVDADVGGEAAEAHDAGGAGGAGSTGGDTESNDPTPITGRLSVQGGSDE